jgi:hypothetical protein
MSRQILLTILLFAFLNVAAPKVAAQLDDSTNKESLRGLKGIVVTVNDVSTEVEHDGLTKSKLQTDIELKLRQAGIRVLSFQEWEHAKDQTIGWLDLYVGALRSDTRSFYACSVRLKLMQSVSLVRDSSKLTFATTWSTGSVGIYGISNIAKIRSEVADKVDEFINNYLAVNPKIT